MNAAVLQAAAAALAAALVLTASPPVLASSPTTQTWAIRESYMFPGSVGASLVFELHQTAGFSVGFHQQGREGVTDDHTAAFFRLERDGTEIGYDRWFGGAVSPGGMAEIAAAGKNLNIQPIAPLFHGRGGGNGEYYIPSSAPAGKWRVVMFGDALSGTNWTVLEFATTDPTATTRWEFSPVVFQLFGFQSGEAVYYRTYVGNVAAGSTLGAAVASGTSAWSFDHGLWGFSFYGRGDTGFDEHEATWTLPDGLKKDADNVVFEGAPVGTYTLDLTEASAGTWPGKLWFLGADLSP